jgi:xeroderma pigmentosum group C-complementing protein
LNFADDDDSREKVKVPKDGVEIVLNEFGDNQRSGEKKPVDVEAQLKRKINRARKEHQERLHKSQLLSWIGHCNFVNTRLNAMDLIKSALKLLPKNGKKCYPTVKTDIEYFKQITNWFKHQIKLRNKDMYCTRLKNRPPLMMSLALQMKFQKAICRRDYVLIFVILLRAIGIQCRMVQSINCEPKICPKTELMSLSKKLPTKSANKSSSSSSRSKSSKGKGKVKIPQLDGGDNEIPSRRSTRKALKASEENGSKRTETFKPAAKITVSVDSPNRIQKTSSKAAKNNEKMSVAAKLSQNLKMSKEKATLKIFSPRKTRSMSHDDVPKPSTSRQLISSKNKKEVEKKTPATLSKSSKDTLKIVLPKGTRSRSNSNENQKQNEKKNLPNLKKLTEKRKATDDPSPIPTKSRRESKTAARTSSSKENESKSPEEKRASSTRKRESSSKTEIANSKKSRISNASESSEGSLKYFKTVKNVSKTSLNSSLTPSKILKPSPQISKLFDRRILSSDDEEANQPAQSPRKKKQGIDIWVEVYAEKEEKWMAIDVLQGKVDCPKEMAKKATNPLTYVFAWNNDNSIKDISARYVEKLNSAAVRKTRVDREYLNSVLHLFSGVRTARDFKEDTELNDILLAATMPTSIAE